MDTGHRLVISRSPRAVGGSIDIAAPQLVMINDLLLPVIPRAKPLEMGEATPILGVPFLIFWMLSFRLRRLHLGLLFLFRTEIPLVLRLDGVLTRGVRRPFLPG